MYNATKPLEQALLGESRQRAATRVLITWGMREKESGRESGRERETGRHSRVEYRESRRESVWERETGRHSRVEYRESKRQSVPSDFEQRLQVPLSRSCWRPLNG
jgi:hypothetical protein